MKAYIVNVGDEVLSGKVINTNASFLSSELEPLGIEVEKIITVGDNKCTIINTVNEFLVSNAKLMITTGGLGPTHDDFTKEVICECLGQKLIYNEQAASDMSNYFGEIKTDCNVKQAYYPQDSLVIPNKIGTADGVILTHQQKYLILLVGPPFEMQPMFLEYVVPFLKDKGHHKLIKDYIVMGNSESYFENILTPLIKRSENVNLAPYASNGKVRFRISTYIENKTDFEICCHEFEKLIGNYIISDEGQDIEEVLVNELTKLKMTISFAESVTGGLLAQMITSVSGASNVLKSSYITYSEEAKMKIMKVKDTTIKQFDVVSNEVTDEMVKGLYALTDSNVCISVSGYAGPTGADVGKICFSIKVKDQNYHETKYFKGTRDMIRSRAARYILFITHLLINEKEV